LKGMMDENVTSRIEKLGIIAVLVIDEPDDAVTVARVLMENGVGAMELTLRRANAFESLRRIRDSIPGMMAGVGTILTTEQVQVSLGGRAEFGVAPGYNRDIVAFAGEMGLPFAPGIATASDIEGAVSQGCRILKFFPAEPMGGTDYLRSLNAPYGHLGLRYIPLGGVGPANLASYLAMKEVIAIGGSWIAPEELIRAKDWVKIGRNAREAMEVLRIVRSGG